VVPEAPADELALVRAEPDRTHGHDAGADAAVTDLAVLSELIRRVETVFHGKTDVVRFALAALLARGHILFEDIPGVGKTTLARSLAAALGLSFRRVQFTSDLLPSDILGVSLYNPQTATFEVRPGPIFTHIVVADEINRAPPRTQSGLLEAMQEGRVTIDERTHTLPRPFLVMATQNPLEHHGTYPLPESQLDRFLMRLTIGYPDETAERRILLESVGPEDPVMGLRPVLTQPQVLSLQERVDRVHADETLVDYVMAVITATRAHARLRLGASPRAAIGLFRAARALALVDGRDFLVPDDVAGAAPACLAHRVVPHGAAAATAEAHDEAAGIIEEILEAVPLPV
jgi:MoxR-like ATPase